MDSVRAIAQLADETVCDSRTRHDSPLSETISCHFAQGFLTQSSTSNMNEYVICIIRASRADGALHSFLECESISVRVSGNPILDRR
jgi:hypothetical protein